VRGFGHHWSQRRFADYLLQLGRARTAKGPSLYLYERGGFRSTAQVGAGLVHGG